MQQPIHPSRRALMLAAALSAATLAGCAKKTPDTLPPSPIGANAIVPSTSPSSCKTSPFGNAQVIVVWKWARRSARPCIICKSRR